MDYYPERLKKELKKVLDFWIKHAVAKDTGKLYSEINIDGSGNDNKSIGSLYLGRIIYGASAACRFLDTKEYKILADLAFKELYERFRNPQGGYYWAKDNNGNILHSEHINLANANILNGLSEYTMLTNNPVVKSELIKLHAHFSKKIYDNTEKCYPDGWSVNWKINDEPTYSLATHLSLLVGFTNYYRCSGEERIAYDIQELSRILITRFINTSQNTCIRSFDQNWNVISNDFSAGINAQVLWLLMWASKITDDSKMYSQCCNIGKNLLDNILETAFDKEYGGVYDTIINGKPAEFHKIWWPQAEVAIACLYTYRCSKDKVHLSYAIRLIEYIENTFSDDNTGEWLAQVSREGVPDCSVPKTSLWKALYHNVRYCIETSNLLTELISK